MISRFKLAWIAASFVLVALSAVAQAQPASPAIRPLPLVSPIFGDNMVLQRGKANTIWGWSEPGDIIQVEI